MITDATAAAYPQNAEYARALAADRERAEREASAAAAAETAQLQRAACRGVALAAALRGAALEARGEDDSACCQLRIDVPGTPLQVQLRLRSQECGAALYAAVRVQLLQHAMDDEHSALVALQELVRCFSDSGRRPQMMSNAFLTAATFALSDRRMRPRFLAAWC